jgi:hypothetical protein
MVRIYIPASPFLISVNLFFVENIHKFKCLEVVKCGVDKIYQKIKFIPAGIENLRPSRFTHKSIKYIKFQLHTFVFDCLYDFLTTALCFINFHYV